ncbi:hypothetical protein [Streptomyces californicus]|uniref:hypothetical protein n=1 Tax=Streptomyces californicus TaxID=67351 RepID=UPI003796AEE4
MLTHHAIGGGVRCGPFQQAAVMLGLGPEDAVPHAFPCVGCSTVAIHPRIDVFFAVMPVRPEREAVEGCDEHVLVQAVFTKNDLGGGRIL